MYFVSFKYISLHLTIWPITARTTTEAGLHVAMNIMSSTCDDKTLLSEAYWWSATEPHHYN